MKFIDKTYPNFCLGGVLDNTDPTKAVCYPKIIYASRTHSQLSQVIKYIINF